MAKTDITFEQARGLVDRVAQELGLLVADKSGFLKVEGPGNKHRLYVQKSKTLGRIDLTIPLPPDDPMYVQLKAPNGSIACHVAPSLENLERALRLLADSNQPTQVPNKPKPFAATKSLGRRTPRAIAPAIGPILAAETAVQAQGKKPFTIDGMTLEDRLEGIKATARRARVNRLIENGQAETVDEAEAILDRHVSERDLASSQRDAERAEAQDVVREAGIEIEQR